MKIKIAGDLKPPLEDALEHHGVKGMHWGVRRGPNGVRPIAQKLNDSRFGKVANANAQRHMNNQIRKEAKSAKLSRADKKRMTQHEQNQFYQNKADKILKAAMQGDHTLISLHTGSGHMIVTGKEFVDHMSSGGVMNIKFTDVYARRGNSGPFILNPNFNKPFVPSFKKK